MDSIIGDVSSLYKLALSAIKKQVTSILQDDGLNDEGVESAVTDLFNTSHFANLFFRFRNSPSAIAVHQEKLQFCGIIVVCLNIYDDNVVYCVPRNLSRLY